MKFNLTAWLSVVALFIALIACENNRIPTSPRFRIKKITKQSAQELSTDTYSYDNQGKLDNIYKAYSDRRQTSNRDYYYKTAFQYDEKGKLKSVEYQPDYTAPGTIIPSRYDYEYDGNGNAVIIKYAQTSSDAATNQLSRTTFNLVYNGTKWPIKITAVSDVFMDGSMTEYIYDQENVVKIKKDYFDNTGRIKDSYTRTYQFDDKPNPFYALYIGAPDPDIFSDYTFKLSTFYQSNTFSKNNILYPNLNYEYDSTGSLVRIAGNPTTTFEYEMY